MSRRKARHWWSSALKRPLSASPIRVPARFTLPQALTLTGTGDLILHEGALHIQPAPSIYPSRAGSTIPLPSRTAWGTARPPKALTVSGGSLDVRGGGAAVRSTRVNGPALLVSVGLLDQGFDEEGGDAPRSDGMDESSFSYSGVALAVNVRESDLGGEGEGEQALAEGSR